jgi:hypothetical protein
MAVDLFTIRIVLRRSSAVAAFLATYAAYAAAAATVPTAITRSVQLGDDMVLPRSSDRPLYRARPGVANPADPTGGGRPNQIS